MPNYGGNSFLRKSAKNARSAELCVIGKGLKVTDKIIP